MVAPEHLRGSIFELPLKCSKLQYEVMQINL